MMNKEHLVNPLSHMLEVPRSQLTANFHFLQNTSAAAAAAIIHPGTKVGGGPLDGSTINFLPINNNGIIDASMRGNACIAVSTSSSGNSSLAGLAHHQSSGHAADALGVFTSVTAAAAHHYGGPLNMVTTSNIVAPNAHHHHHHHQQQHQQHQNNHHQQHQQQVHEHQQQQHINAAVARAATHISSASSGNDAMGHIEPHFKYIDASKHLSAATSVGSGAGGAATTMHVGTGDITERITVKIDPVDVAPLSGRGDQQLMQQMAPSGSQEVHFRIPRSDYGGVVVKEEHHQSHVPDDSVERLIFSHMTNAAAAAVAEHHQHSILKTSSDDAVDKPPKPYKCTDCSYETERKHRLKVHVMAIHTGEKPFKCTQCEYAAARKSTLKEHTLTIHSDHKPFECNECEYRTKKQSNLKVHMRAIHSNDKPFKCNECDYSSALRTMLKKHIERFHSIDSKFFNPLDCLKLSKPRQPRSSGKRRKQQQQQQQQQSQQQEHLLQNSTNGMPIDHTHTATVVTISAAAIPAADGSDKPHQCTFCDFRTARRSNLKAHISTVHLKEKPFKCSECDFMTARRASLRTHMSSIHSVKSNSPK